MKIVWHIDPKPTGKYRSFAHRRWPSAYNLDANGDVIALLRAADDSDYVPSLRETTTLVVRVADYYNPEVEGSFTWRQLKGRPVGFKAAKKLVDAFYKAEPHRKPKENNDED